MPHPAPSPMHIPLSLRTRVAKLPTKTVGGLETVEGFGIFIDTHRDQPHIGTFSPDIHRGVCVPTLVDYVPSDDWLRESTSGTYLPRHDKHLFIAPDEWARFLMNYIMDHGADPRDGSGALPTSHFRDPRKKLYLLKSFRQMVDWNETR